MINVELRNLLASRLADYLGRPVVLSEQVQPEPDYPFMAYTPTAPYINKGGMGNYINRLVEGTADDTAYLLNTRTEQAEAIFSFVACSLNRYENDVYIFGDDEAQAMAEKAVGWFLHVGYFELSLQGVVVLEVMNVGNRTVLEIDEAARRYGFDVRVRYARTDTRRDEIATDYRIKKE